MIWGKQPSRGRRLGVFVAACLAPLLTLVTVAACGSPDTYVVLTFRQHYPVDPHSPAGQIFPPHTSTREVMAVDASGAVLTFAAVTRRRPDGKILELAHWREGEPKLTVWIAAYCRASQQPLPSKPNENAILEDAIGPLTSPAAHGYRRIHGRVFEKVQGPTRYILHLGSGLEDRRLVMESPSTGALQSEISHITLDRYASRPDPVQTPSCTPSLPAPQQQATEGSSQQLGA